MGKLSNTEFIASNEWLENFKSQHNNIINCNQIYIYSNSVVKKILTDRR